MDVSSIFKPSGEPVRLAVAHSTADDLGQRTLDLLRSNLSAGIELVEAVRIADFRELLSFLRQCPPFNVFLLMAHGLRVTNTVRLYEDVDRAGRPLRVNVGELTLLAPALSDRLCVFGVCHFGTQELAQAVCDGAGALACVAPRPSCAISRTDIGQHFAAFLNRLQAHQDVDIGVGELRDLLRESVPPALFENLSIAPVVYQPVV